MFKAMIFDFNGVIVDDEPLHLELFRAVLSEEGIPLTDEGYQAKYLGFDDRGCFQAVLRDAGREAESTDERRIAALIERKASLYVEAINERYLLFPGVVELVKRLAVTNSYPPEKLSQADRIVSSLADCDPGAIFREP
jgi:beta-phosphoglucomutase-like phosphatase (HAD superfamily)